MVVPGQLSKCHVSSIFGDAFPNNDGTVFKLSPVGMALTTLQNSKK